MNLINTVKINIKTSQNKTGVGYAFYIKKTESHIKNAPVRLVLDN